MPSIQKNKSAVKKVSKCKMFPVKSNTTLLIVESPSKCATIMKYLGDGHRCVATCGHMRYLDGLSAIDVNKNYKLKFTIMDSKRAQITRISSEIKMATRIIVATDDDREGESIAWHICDMFHLPIESTERIVFHEITKAALEKAMANPRKVNMNIVTSAHARQILDLLIGYKISPSIWKHISSTGLSAGRCQTPALRLVYDNQREIENRLLINENNKENGFEYAVCGYFTKLNIPFSLENRFKSFFLEQEGERELELETFLRNSISSDHVFMCVENDTHVRHLSPPLPFSTSRLQQTASNDFSISPSETMKICQTLYEHGFITYIRTTGKNYSAEFVGQAKDYVREKWGEKYVKCDDDHKGIHGVDAHEAIRPTDVTRISLTGDFHILEQKMYKLIWKNAVENCMSDYTFSPIVAKINVNIENATYIYKFACQKPVFLGWKAVQGFTPEQQRHCTMMDYLHNVRENSIIPYHKIETSVVSTSHAGAHYTEARLIQALEEKEIGRPSTYSTIIEKIMEREYVKKQNVVGMRIECNEYTLVDKVVSKTKSWREFGNENNKLILTPIGKSVLEFLTCHFPLLFSYDYTKHMEMCLDDIASAANGCDPKDDLKIVCDACVGEIEECINKIKKTKKDETQYRIDDHHIFIIGKHGPVVMYSEKPFPASEEDGCYDKYLNAGINSEENENIVFKKVKPGLIFDDLKKGKYANLSDILVEDSSLERVVGTYGGFSVTLKNGRFGIYVIWGKNGENRKSFKCGKNMSDISLEEVIRHIENDSNNSTSIIDGVAVTTIGDVTDIVRIVNNDMSIRKGNYGCYIFYKTAKMKKPKFISLKTFKLDYNNCSTSDIISWVKTQI